MNKKKGRKSGLFFGTTMAVFFIVRDLLEQDVYTTKNIVHTILGGLIGGALSGLLFGWITGAFTRSKLFATSTNINTDAGETIFFESDANYFKGAEAVGGRLYVTNKRLVFKSHNFNIQNHELSINLQDIATTSRYKTLGFVNNGLLVSTTTNHIEKFVVQQPGEWMNQLNTKSGLQQLYAHSAML